MDGKLCNPSVLNVIPYCCCSKHQWYFPPFSSPVPPCSPDLFWCESKRTFFFLWETPGRRAKAGTVSLHSQHSPWTHLTCTRETVLCTRTETLDHRDTGPRRSERERGRERQSRDWGSVWGSNVITLIQSSCGRFNTSRSFDFPILNCHDMIQSFFKKTSHHLIACHLDDFGYPFLVVCRPHVW